MKLRHTVPCLAILCQLLDDIDALKNVVRCIDMDISVFQCPVFSRALRLLTKVGQVHMSFAEEHRVKDHDHDDELPVSLSGVLSTMGSFRWRLVSLTLTAIPSPRSASFCSFFAQFTELKHVRIISCSAEDLKWPCDGSHHRSLPEIATLALSLSNDNGTSHLVDGIVDGHMFSIQQLQSLEMAVTCKHGQRVPQPVRFLLAVSRYPTLTNIALHGVDSTFSSCDLRPHSGSTNVGWYAVPLGNLTSLVFSVDSQVRRPKDILTWWSSMLRDASISSGIEKVTIEINMDWYGPTGPRLYFWHEWRSLVLEGLNKLELLEELEVVFLSGVSENRSPGHELNERCHRLEVKDFLLLMFSRYLAPRVRLVLVDRSPYLWTNAFKLRR
ncbi:hypothetical protein BDZ89DRAFT_504480 [Hymenopellis radicata]|nr:hypothetical protein BDZ89DRAFT_504480 [Hymenopellis radicata]